VHAFLVDGLRSPIGKYGGGLAPLRATEIASDVTTALFERTGVAPDEVDLVVGGMVLQDMTESNPARIVGQRVGVPDSTPAFTVNMQCTSGMLALMLAAKEVASGRATFALALGMESMSNPPYAIAGARWGVRSGPAEFIDTLDECKLAGSRMWGDPWNMIDVAENHAAVDGVGRDEMDQYVLRTHARAIDAIDSGRLDDEIAPISVPSRNGPTAIGVDEAPRRELSMDTLSSLKPVRPGGVITAGNASPHNDGAAAALVCSTAAVSQLAKEPLARLNLDASALAGCDPHLMGYSAVEAGNAALRQGGFELRDIDLIECNEGFAVQMLACERLGGWPDDAVNVDGGSIALGHPVGMSGLRIVIHLARALLHRDQQRGLATVPAGSGLGAAVVVERAQA
jgi:acetyl-CoA C-acetyltransferase